MIFALALFLSIAVVWIIVAKLDELEAQQRVIASVILKRHYGRVEITDYEWRTLDSIVRDGHPIGCKCGPCQRVAQESIAEILRAE